MAREDIEGCLYVVTIIVIIIDVAFYAINK